MNNLIVKAKRSTINENNNIHEFKLEDISSLLCSPENMMGLFKFIETIIPKEVKEARKKAEEEAKKKAEEEARKKLKKKPRKS